MAKDKPAPSGTDEAYLVKCFGLPDSVTRATSAADAIAKVRAEKGYLRDSRNFTAAPVNAPGPKPFIPPAVKE